MALRGQSCVDERRHERPTVFRTAIFVHLVGGEQPLRIGWHELRRLFRLAERFEDRFHRVTAALVIREVGPEVGLHFALVVQRFFRFCAEARVAVLFVEFNAITLVLAAERGALFAVLSHEEAAFGGLDGDEVHDAHVVGGCVGLHCVRLRVCFSYSLATAFYYGGWRFQFFYRTHMEIFYMIRLLFIERIRTLVITYMHFYKN